MIQLLPTFARALQQILKFHSKGKYAPGPKLTSARGALGMTDSSKKALSAIEGKVKLYENQINNMLRTGKKPDLKLFETQINKELQRFSAGTSLGNVERVHLNKAMLEIRNQIRNLDLTKYGKLGAGTRLTKNALTSADRVFKHTSNNLSGSTTAANKIIKKTMKSDEFKKRVKTIKY
jgi:hypothetical protein